MEVFKDIPGYEGLYQASTLGVIRSVERKDKAGRNTISSRVMVQTPNHKGYLRVSLTDRDGKTVKHNVHKLVLSTFVGSRPEGMEGCHEDGNKSNCAVENLRWDTPKGNWEDRRKHGTATIGAQHPMATTSEAIVIEIKKGLAKGERGIDLAARHGVSTTVVSQIRTGKTWSHINV
jgi:hypothetical protein